MRRGVQELVRRRVMQRLRPNSRDGGIGYEPVQRERPCQFVQGPRASDLRPEYVGQRQRVEIRERVVVGRSRRMDHASNRWISPL